MVVVGRPLRLHDELDAEAELLEDERDADGGQDDKARDGHCDPEP